MKNAIRYKVTVSAVVERIERQGKDWAVIGQEFKEGHPDKPVSVHGYTPEIEKTVLKELQIFDQTVETLDMPALVMIVNGIKP